MNNENYVSLEVAKLLKKKEFEELCTRCYHKDKLWKIKCFNGESILNGDFYATPTLYQVQKWIRETQKIHICVDFNASGWYCRLYEIPYGEFILQTEGYKDSYEKALNAGILEALKLI